MMAPQKSSMTLRYFIVVVVVVWVGLRFDGVDINEIGVGWGVRSILILPKYNVLLKTMGFSVLNKLSMKYNNF